MKNHTETFWFITFPAKPLSIRVNKIDGFIKVYDETRYLVLFNSEKYDAIYNRIRYLISQNYGSHDYGKTIFDSLISIAT